MGWNREYWMVYGGLNFLAVVWYGSWSTPPPQSKSSTGDTQEDREGELYEGEGWRGWARSQFIRSRDSLALNTIWAENTISKHVRQHGRILQEEYRKIILKLNCTLCTVGALGRGVCRPVGMGVLLCMIDSSPVISLYLLHWTVQRRPLETRNSFSTFFALNV